MLKKRGLDAHKIKYEYLGSRAQVSRYDLFYKTGIIYILSKAGEIISISVGDGYEHFDGDNSPHLHLHCRCCGKITDAMLESDSIADTAVKNGFTPENSVCVVYGVCKSCNTKNKN